MIKSFFKCPSLETVQINIEKTTVKEYKNSYEIMVCGNDDEAILNAFNKAICLPHDEVSEYDSIKIVLSDTLYILNKTLELKGESKNYLPIIFSSNHKAVISGGFSFSGGFSKYDDNIYVRELKAESFRQLYVNGELAIRSRFPNKNSDYKKECIEGKWLDNTKEYLLPSDFSPYLKNYCDTDLEIHMVEAWTHSIAKTRSLKTDDKGNLFKLTKQNEELFFGNRSTKLKKPKTWLENSLELVDEPNEWYYDKAQEKLYYIPLNEQDINSITFTVPQIEVLVSVNSINNIRFDNIQFKYANWNYPTENGFPEVQGTNYLKFVTDSNDWEKPPAAIEVSSSNSVEIINCVIANVGASAVKYDEACNDVLIYYNDIYNVGAGAIVVGCFDPKPLECPISKNIVIADNVIKHIGKSYLGGVGIIAGYADDLSIDHNEVYDCGYSGISVGWGWGVHSRMNNYKIRNNKVTNIINHYLYDGAGLYTLGVFDTSTVNIITGNYFEGGHGYAGLYFDEMSNNYLAKYNYIGKGKKWFLLMHDVNYGISNVQVKENFVETTKKFVNSYNFDKKKSNKKLNLKQKNVIIRNNYTNICDNWQISVDVIESNSGRRNNN